MLTRVHLSLSISRRRLPRHQLPRRWVGRFSRGGGCHSIAGIIDGATESQSSLGRAMEVLLGAASMAGVPGRTDA
jgi:hypothetical protein